jgi:hypothetical protein
VAGNYVATSKVEDRRYGHTEQLSHLDCVEHVEIREIGVGGLRRSHLLSITAK